MVYRTRTYIAGEWTGDSDAINQLHKWNNSNNWSLTFTDAHELTQARDGSLNCNIKKSLKERMDSSKTFILVVGDKTNSVTAGGCQLCQSYNSYTSACAKGYYIDYKSYIKFECEKAVEANIKIIVLYNSTAVDKSKCPEAVKKLGTHVAMVFRGQDGKLYWDYKSVYNALNS